MACGIKWSKIWLAADEEDRKAYERNKAKSAQQLANYHKLLDANYLHNNLIVNRQYRQHQLTPQNNLFLCWNHWPAFHWY